MYTIPDLAGGLNVTQDRESEAAETTGQTMARITSYRIMRP